MATTEERSTPVAAIGEADRPALRNGPVPQAGYPKAVRRATFLLRSLANHEQEEEECGSRLEVSSIRPRRASSLGLASFEIVNLDESISTTECIRFDDREPFVTQLRALEPEQDNQNELVNELKSGWFLDFASSVLDRRYPIDRFSLFMGIWISAAECRYRELECILSQLIEGLVHEEPSSSSLEDVSQLTQVGAFWLTERKSQIEMALINNSKQIDLDPSSCVNDDGATESETDSDSRSSNSPASSCDETAQHNGQPGLKQPTLERSRDPRKELKRLLEEEFLCGYRCLLCANWNSRKLLASIELHSCELCACPVARPRCALSARPLPFVALERIRAFKPGLERVALVSAAEWLRFYLEASALSIRKSTSTRGGNLGNRERNFDRDSLGSPSEKVDIARDFERLTVVRKNNHSTSDSDGNSDSESLARSDEITDSEESASPGEAEDERGANEKAGEKWNYERQLTSFMRARHRQQLTARLQRPLPSESVRLLRHARPGERVMALNCADLIVLESPSSLFERPTWRLGLVGSHAHLEWGPIVGCLRAAARSRLELGCGRLYCELELIKLDGRSDRCPVCECQLEELLHLDELLARAHRVA